VAESVKEDYSIACRHIGVITLPTLHGSDKSMKGWRKDKKGQDPHPLDLNMSANCPGIPISGSIPSVLICPYGCLYIHTFIHQHQNKPALSPSSPTFMARSLCGGQWAWTPAYSLCHQGLVPARPRAHEVHAAGPAWCVRVECRMHRLRH
jgi:hypothetical protein